MGTVVVVEAEFDDELVVVLGVESVELIVFVFGNFVYVFAAVAVGTVGVVVCVDVLVVFVVVFGVCAGFGVSTGFLIYTGLTIGTGVETGAETSTFKLSVLSV